MVDDNQEFVQLMTKFLERRGYEVLVAPSALHAFQILRSRAVDVLLADEFMPRGGSGILLLEAASATYAGMALALLGGAPTSDAIFRATDIGATVITKGAPGELLEFLCEVETRLSSAIHGRPGGSDSGTGSSGSSVSS